MAFRTVGFTDIFSTKSEKTLQERMTAVWTYPNRLYDPNNYSLELIIGEYLIDFFDHENGGDMISKIRILREQLKNEIGFDPTKNDKSVWLIFPADSRRFLHISKYSHHNY